VDKSTQDPLDLQSTLNCRPPRAKQTKVLGTLKLNQDACL